MYSYKQELGNIKEMLNLFLKTKTIDTHQLSKMDSLIERSETDQIKALNCSAPLNTQRIMFGAIRNISTSIKGIKEKLKTAVLRHENPTTAEKALELMESLFNVASCVDSFIDENRIPVNLENVAKLSRILYRKAKSFGFSEDLQEQLKRAGVTEAQVKTFICNFDNNIAQELDIEGEVKSKFENNG